MSPNLFFKPEIYSSTKNYFLAQDIKENILKQYDIIAGLRKRYKTAEEKELTNCDFFIEKLITATEELINSQKRSNSFWKKNEQDNLNFLSQTFDKLKAFKDNPNNILDLSHRNKLKAIHNSSGDRCILAIAKNLDSLGTLLYINQEIDKSKTKIAGLKTELQKLQVAPQLSL